MPSLADAKLGQFFANEQLLATTLLTLCIDTLGSEFFEWEPDALTLEIKQRFGVDLPQVNKDKIWAAVAVVTTNTFYVSLESFIPICNSLNNSVADFAHYDQVTSEEAAWALVEAQLLDPPADNQEQASRYSEEIRSYITVTLQAEGITTPPLVLQPYVNMPADMDDKIGAVLGPDEHMYNAYVKRQAAAKTAIEDYVADRLETLTAQLKLLPLVNGKTAKIDQYLAQATKALTGSRTIAVQEPVAQ